MRGCDKSQGRSARPTRYTYQASKTDLWPYEEEFLENKKADARLTEAERRATNRLLSAVVTKTPAAAALWAKKTCEGKDAKECLEVGMSYATGKGADKDLTKAAALFQMSCEGGFAGGCYDIGVLSAKGWGVPQDKAKAAALYQKACDGHSKEACDALKRGVQ